MSSNSYDFMSDLPGILMFVVGWFLAVCGIFYLRFGGWRGVAICLLGMVVLIVAMALFIFIAWKLGIGPHGE